MPQQIVKRDYQFWIENPFEITPNLKDVDIYIGLAEDEEGYGYSYYGCVPVTVDGQSISVDFSVIGFSFIGIKTLEKPQRRKRYALGEYEFEEPDDKTRYNYQMLSRLKSDCEYVLGAFSKNGTERLSEQSISTVLWGGGIAAHFREMYHLYDGFLEDERPEWLTREEIDQYQFKIQQLTKGK